MMMIWIRLMAVTRERSRQTQYIFTKYKLVAIEEEENIK